MLTSFYIDGFNLYYGCLKQQPQYKWLNLASFCEQSFPPPRNQLHRIRYFTAHIRPRASDPLKGVRQQTFLRAARTIPNLTIHLGHYLESKVKACLVSPLANGTRFVEVHKSEEKGSDVNIATYLLLDAFKNDFGAAVVVSNDSDLAEPIRVVRQELGKPVIVLMPCCNGRRQSVQLKKAASRAICVNPGILASSQFPSKLTDTVGDFHKPPTWV